jgi:hypothetical protein
MAAVLSLDGWDDIAQFVIAIGGVGALIGVYLQLRLGHATSRRARVYDYADCFNKRDSHVQHRLRRLQLDTGNPGGVPFQVR